MVTPNKAKHYSSYYVIKRIFREYVSKYLGKIYLAILFMGIFAFANAATVWLVKPALDGVFVDKNIKLLWLIPGLVLVISPIKALADYFQSYIIKFVGQNILNDLQLDLYVHLLRSDLSFLNKQSSGKLLSKFTNDISNLKTAISLIIVDLIKELLTVIGLIAIMFYNETTLSLVAFVVFPLAVIPISKIGKKMREVAHKTQEELCNYTVKLDENFRNIKVIKAFCTEKHEINNAKKHLDSLLTCYSKAMRVESMASPITEMLGSVAVAGIILYGGNQVLLGATSPGSFFVFVVAFIAAYKPVKSLAHLNVVLQNGLISARRIFTMLDTKQKIENQGHTKQLKITKSPSIEFKNVSFKHEGRKDALNNVSLRIYPNQFIALVGESGSGKSTLIDLLLKFYIPSAGSIYINDQNLVDIASTSIRNNISFVSQDIMLFDKSIKDNISYGSNNTSKKAITHVATMSSVGGFIDELEENYDTFVGQFGIQLSGGQKQKIAIARAMLKDSPILIFDEATSALDQVSEKIVKNSLMSLKSNKTIIMVTHRLSTIQDADVIYAMKDGNIVEAGKHAELVAKKGEYHRLYSKKIVN
jgi:ATP-binding cassette, subfamily B, bacterial MsbA